MTDEQPTILLAVTPDEYDTIIQGRERKEFYRLRREQQKSCDHDWKYAGHGHNDDCYECRKCRDTKWV